MPIKLSQEEKRYLIALFGDDMPMWKRERLFSVSSFPAQAGPLVMAEGYKFLATINGGRIAARKPGTYVTSFT